MKNEKEIKNLIDEVIDKGVEFTFNILHYDKLDFYNTNKSEIFKVIDEYISNNKLTLNQLYCLTMLRMEDKIAKYIIFLNSITGINAKCAKLLSFMCELSDYDDGGKNTELLENNLEYFEECIKNYLN